MNRLLVTVLALGSVLHAADVTLSGTVKDSASKPVEGATVKLAKIQNLSAVTKADGSFLLTNVTSVLQPVSQQTACEVSFKNNTVVFTAGTQRVSGSVSLYSGDGRQVFSATIVNLSNGQQEISFPELHSGIYVLAGTVNGETFTRSVVSMGNTLFVQNEAGNAAGNRSFSLTKKGTAAVNDTLIVTKDSLDTNKTPVTSYIKDGIAIVMKKKGASGAFTITSTAFKNGDEMPDAYTCEGKAFGGGIAPPLAWTGIPAAAKSLALFFKDTTAAAGATPSNGYHWGMWNIPVTVTGMPEGLNGDAKPAAMGGAEQKSAITTNGSQFFGPCPDFSKKGGIKDIYFITLYAFDKEKITPPTSSLVQMDKYFDDNDIAKTHLEVWSDAKPK